MKRTLDEQVTVQEKKLADLKARASKRRAIQGGGITKKLSKLARALRSMGKQPSFELSDDCASFAAKLEDEIAVLAGQIDFTKAE